jgi:hypothetical protein
MALEAGTRIDQFCAFFATGKKYMSPASRYKTNGDSSAGFDYTQNWALGGQTIIR